ncbi:uncharacterized protein LOC131951735 [Physella acuta]|uniref:uncharacterized protein LOC131951735 n=1 Tax=Physella acuta TaxID=109671 RepID=UPI0027DBD441|nr:uncharacterized protein LOC131951735 [Physella acuta]
MTQRLQQPSAKRSVEFEEVALKTFANQTSEAASGFEPGASTSNSTRASQRKTKLGIPDLSAINKARHLDQTRGDNSLRETRKGGKKVTVLEIGGGSGQTGAGNSSSKGPSDESSGKAARRVKIDSLSGRNKAAPSVDSKENLTADIPQENLTADIPQSLSTDSGIGSPTDVTGGVGHVDEDIDENIADDNHDNPSGSSLIHRTSTVPSNQSTHYRPCPNQGDLTSCVTADDNSCVTADDISFPTRQTTPSSKTTTQNQDFKGENPKTLGNFLPCERTSDVISPGLPDVTVPTTHPDNTGASQSDSLTNSGSLESRDPLTNSGSLESRDPQTSEVLTEVLAPGVCALSRSEVSQSWGGGQPVDGGVDVTSVDGGVDVTSVDGGVNVTSVDIGCHHSLTACLTSDTNLKQTIDEVTSVEAGEASQKVSVVTSPEVIFPEFLTSDHIPPEKPLRKKPTFKDVSLREIISLSESPDTGRKIKGILKSTSVPSLHHVTDLPASRDCLQVRNGLPKPDLASCRSVSFNKLHTKNTFSYYNAAFEGEVITEPSKRPSLADVVSHMMRQSTIVELDEDNSHPYGRDSSLTDLITGKRRDSYTVDAGKMIVWLVLAIMIVSLAGGIIFMSETYNMNQKNDVTIASIETTTWSKSYSR